MFLKNKSKNKIFFFWFYKSIINSIYIEFSLSFIKNENSFVIINKLKNDTLLIIINVN